LGGVLFACTGDLEAAFFVILGEFPMMENDGRGDDKQ
jgi:hypothetical protein